MPVIVRGRTITDARLRQAALSAAVHESHRTAKDVLGGKPAHTALDRFAALLDLLTLRRDTMLQDGLLDEFDPKVWRRGF